MCVCVRVFFFLFLVLPFLAAPSLLAEEFLLLTSVISVIYVILYKTLSTVGSMVVKNRVTSQKM